MLVQDVYTVALLLKMIILSVKVALFIKWLNAEHQIYHREFYFSFIWSSNCWRSSQLQITKKNSINWASSTNYSIYFSFILFET